MREACEQIDDHHQRTGRVHEIRERALGAVTESTTAA